MNKEKMYQQWKKAAEEAVKKGRTAKCDTCKDPIVPGDFVGVCIDPNDREKELFVHAGFHFSISQMDAFCETAGIGCGYWDGEKLVNEQESAIAAAARTGEVQVR
jgi:hypothetical protein